MAADSLFSPRVRRSFYLRDMTGSKEERPGRPRCLPDCDSLTRAEANVYGKRS